MTAEKDEIRENLNSIIKIVGNDQSEKKTFKFYLLQDF